MSYRAAASDLLQDDGQVQDPGFTSGGPDLQGWGCSNSNQELSAEEPFLRLRCKIS